MAKKVAVKVAVKTARVSKAQRQLQELIATIKDYRQKLYARKTVAHSTTPIVQEQNGQKLPTRILVGELLTIASTARMLGKQVMLRAEPNNLVIEIVDQAPDFPVSTLYF